MSTGSANKQGVAESRRQTWDNVLTDLLKSDNIETGTLNPEAAKLAENENEFIEFLHQSDDQASIKELAKWIGSVLGEELDHQNFAEELKSGVRLLYLAKSIQLVKCDHMKDENYVQISKELYPDNVNISDHQFHQRASLLARQRSNIAKFLRWCSQFGVPSISLFESEDLANGKNLHQVITCLLYVSRIAARYGIEPPDSIKEEIEQEGKRFLRKQATVSNRSDMDSTEDNSGLISSKPPISEVSEDEHLQMSQDFSENKGQIEFTSTPSSLYDRGEADNMERRFVPIVPSELDFEEDLETDSIVIERAQDPKTKTMHFNPKPFIEDIEITEEQDMVIVNQLELPTDVAIELTGNEADFNGAVSLLNLKENDKTSKSTSTGSSTCENEYYTAYDMNPSDDDSDVIYRTTHADDVIGESEEREECEEREENQVEYERIPQITLFRDISKSEERKKMLPFMLHPIPADVTIEANDEYGSSEDSGTDVESYTSSDEYDVKYTDVGVGTDDYVKQQKEIMINFPPYFEFLSRPQSTHSRQNEYVVEPIYAVSTKSKSAKSQTTYNNEAFEEERQEPQGQTPPTIQPSVSVMATPSPVSSPTPVSGRQVEMGTQTHVSLMDDVVRIINEKGDIPKIRTTLSRDPAMSTGSVGRSVLGSAGIEQSLPAQNRNIVVVQTLDRESGRPPRFGSVTGSSRIKNRDVEAARPAPVRRSMLRRASSVVSEQFEKAVVAAKKYRTEIAVICILIAITAAVLIVMSIVFPLT